MTSGDLTRLPPLARRLVSQRTTLSWQIGHQVTHVDHGAAVGSGRCGKSEAHPDSSHAHLPQVKVSVSSLTTKRWNLLEDVCGVQDAGLSSLGLWRPKLLDFGEERSIELLRDRQVDVSTVSFAGGFTGTNGHRFEDAVSDARDAIRLAGQVGADAVILVSGSRGAHTLNHARRLLLDAIRELTGPAESVGVDIALLPMHPMFAADWTFLSCLDDTIDIIAMASHPRVKLAFDTYHLWQEPQLLARLPELVPLISAVQISDWREPPRSRHDRALPGEGVIPLAGIVETLVRSGYRGHFDLQVWSEESWLSDPSALVKRAKSGFEKLLPRIALPARQVAH